MFLAEIVSGDLVEILDICDLSNPFKTSLLIQFQRGEDLAEPEFMDKSKLCFPSGEDLPNCWLDGHYRIK
ncbi:MAG: acetyltransferase [Gammaproteobacteria bacterium]|nr:acetyltransferase [Gammaproteobacteria bacterium]